MAIVYNSNYDETIPFSDVCKVFALAANTEQTYTIPGNDTVNYSVRFGLNSTSNVFVANNKTATIPAGGASTSVQFNEYRPEIQRQVKGGDILSFITPDATAYVGISLRQFNQ